MQGIEFGTISVIRSLRGIRSADANDTVIDEKTPINPGEQIPSDSNDIGPDTYGLWVSFEHLSLPPS